MSISVHGKNFDTGPSLQTFTQNAIKDVCEKYYGGLISANVFLEKDSFIYKSSISVHVQRNMRFQVHGQADDPYDAVKDACANLDKQLRRSKRIAQSQVRRRDPVAEALSMSM